MPQTIGTKEWIKVKYGRRTNKINTKQWGVKILLYGYGKILDVDLMTKIVVKRDVSPEFARKYVGGMGFGCRILYDEVGPEVDPLSPANILIFSNGPLTGTEAPCSGRTEITTKSPLTDNIGTGNTGGLWGARLKHAGFDVLIVRGKSEKPVYLWIDDDNIEIRDAEHIWGKDTWTTTDALTKELDPSRPSSISVLAIGPAGENLVRYACPVNDYHHVAGRTGAGAVMGVKRLKAIAVRGTKAVKIARPEKFKEIAREVRERVIAAYKARVYAKDEKIEVCERGCLPTKNYQTGVLEGWLEAMRSEVAERYVVRREGCYACPLQCFDIVEVKEGKYGGTKIGRGTFPGITFDVGAKLAFKSLPAVWRFKQLCHELGLDYVSAAGTIAFAMELYQRGIITKSDTDGLELSWGDDEVAILLLKKIAYREGFGNILAEGSVRAAKIIGRGAEKYVMAVKGMEMMLTDPRAERRGWIFGVLTNPRGGDNVKNTHCFAERYNPEWWIDKFDMPDHVKQEIYGDVSPEELPNTWKGKALMCKYFEELYSIINALGLCFFPAGFWPAIGPNYLAKLLSACTGWDVTPEEIMKLGERVFTMFKAYAVRQGFTRKDDTFPDRFFEEALPEGPAKGAKLSKETIEQLLDEYYELRGWDKSMGVPTKQKLIELELDDIAQDLLQRGKIPPK